MSDDRRKEQINELHIFLADTGSEEKLQAWIDRLTSLEALNPEIIIPSHADLNASFDKKALSATKEYLQKAIEFTKASSRSEELAASLKTAYPDYMILEPRFSLEKFSGGDYVKAYSFQNGILSMKSQFVISRNLRKEFYYNISSFKRNCSIPR